MSQDFHRLWLGVYLKLKPGLILGQAGTGLAQAQAALKLALAIIVMWWLPWLSQAQSPTRICAEDYTIQVNDWLSKIAERYLADTASYPLIVEATNRMAATDSSYAVIDNANLIEPGWKLCIPVLDAPQNPTPKVPPEHDETDLESSTLSPSTETSKTLPSETRHRVTHIELLGIENFRTGYIVTDTEVGGLSGLVYDPDSDLYYALSDDRSLNGPARFYALRINLSDGRLDKGDISFDSVTHLRNETGQSYPERSLDPEALALGLNNILFIASEGDSDQNPPLNPFIQGYTLSGDLNSTLTIPEKFLPMLSNGELVRGVRNNLAFESLTISPNKRYLYAAVEGALAQDGPTTGVDRTSLARVIQYDLGSRQAVAEYVYVVDPVPEAPDPIDGLSLNGLVELLAIDNAGTFLSLERAFSAGKGNTIVLYQVHLDDAADVSDQAELAGADGSELDLDVAIRKEFLLDFSSMVSFVDNLEGMAWGPSLPDGRQVLIVVSDNNFNAFQRTQFIALALRFEQDPLTVP